MSSLFGPTAKSAIFATNQEFPPVPDEDNLLQQLRLKLGPHANQGLLEYHVRACRGKLHWAVNRYFRDVLLEAGSGAPLDYEPKRRRTDAGRATPSDVSGASASRAGSPPGAARVDQSGAAGLDSLPCAVLEEICQSLDVTSLCAFAQVSRACLKAAHADAAWRHLFTARWSLEFPINPHASAAPAPLPNPSHPPAPHPPAPSSHPPPPAAPASPQRLHAGPSSVPSPQPLQLSAALPVHPSERPTSNTPTSSTPHSSLLLTSLATQLPTLLTQAAPQPPAPQPTMLQPTAHQPAPPEPPSHPPPAVETAPASLPCPFTCPRTPNPTPTPAPTPSTSSTPPAAAAAAATAAAPRPATWRDRYHSQHRYEATMACPRCSGQRIVPIVYGFPSPALMAGMKLGRLLLGGDHLIENCHVWACTACNASYRSFPFRHVHLWVNDQDHLSRGGQDGQGHRAYTYEL